MQNWHLDLTNLLEKKKTTVVKKVPKDTTSKKTESKFKAIRREISEDFPVLPNRTEKETESFNETFDFKWEGEINLPYYDDYENIEELLKIIPRIIDLTKCKWFEERSVLQYSQRYYDYFYWKIRKFWDAEEPIEKVLNRKILPSLHILTLLSSIVDLDKNRLIPFVCTLMS
jgi:hypothetical protein